MLNKKQEKNAADGPKYRAAQIQTPANAKQNGSSPNRAKARLRQ